ncbi:helix-turn-helix domain-containing protein [Geobacillus sp. JS12]|uniref:helix-turn-helix domain-containing protein n=1 Tax=Geobacillus sp. JS12 TaxID=1813182 RepID=UPI001F1B032F|nr:XRE family transcriptional regulator [Geobacillus sp. JS12]
MMEIKQTIAKNLNRVKNELGLKNQDLAEMMGVTRQTIAKYLKGEQIPDSAKLFLLSRRLNIPMKDLIVSSDDQREPMSSFMFRADNPKENFRLIDQNQVNRIMDDYYELLASFGEASVAYLPPTYKVKLVDHELTVEHKAIIRQAAEQTRKMFGLDHVTPSDIYAVLEHHGIHVIALKTIDKKIDGLSAYSEEKGAFIFLNDHDEIPEERKRFSVIHELGHLIFHREEYRSDLSSLTYSSARKEINEKVATLFASYFLIPREQLREYAYYFKRYVTLETIMELKRQFFVSAEAFMRALLDEQYISGRTYGHLRKTLWEQGYKEQEPAPIEYIPKNRKLTYFVKQAYFEGSITINKVCEILGCDLRTAREMIKGWYKEHGCSENTGAL